MARRRPAASPLIPDRARFAGILWDGSRASFERSDLHYQLGLNMQNKFFPQGVSSFNIVGEIPGTAPALKDEVVMIGAHFDSWHSGTGATDNGAGSGVMLEAMRVLKTLGLAPSGYHSHRLVDRRGRGLMVARVCEDTSAIPLARDSIPRGTEKTRRVLQRRQWERQDRRIYLQGIDAERAIFDAWMRPFNDMGMKTTTISNTGGTDHLSYIAVGLPGFQFIQDPLDYGNVTHHTNQDVYERLQPDDMMFNSAVVASFAWQAAQRDAMLPRPPQP